MVHEIGAKGSGKECVSHSHHSQVHQCDYLR